MTRALVLSLAIMCCTASYALAQVAPAPQPAAQAPAAPTTDVRISSSAYGSYGNPQIATAVEQPAENAVEAGADALFFANRQGPRTTLTVTAGSLMRQFSEERQRDYWSHWASTQLTRAVTPRTSMTLDLRGGYSQFSALGGGPRPDGAGRVDDQIRDADFGVSSEPTVTYAGALQLARQMSTRSSLAFAAESQGSSIRGGTGDMREHRGHVVFVNRFRRRASVNLEYGFRQAEYATGGISLPVVRQHVATISFGREWVHSPTRQSALRVGFGPSIVLLNSRYEYLATGQLSVESRLSEGWTVVVGASRDMTVVAGLGRRVIADTAYAQVHTQLSRTVDVLVHARVSNGTAPFDALSGSYQSHGGSARVSWAFARTLSAFGEVLDTYYTLAGSLQGAGVTGQRDRRSVRVGLTWLLPLKGPSRTHAAR